MNTSLSNLRRTRQLLLEGLKDLSPEQWNEIPEGFSNNIAWNTGHLVAAMQGLCYKRSGLPLYTTEDFFEQYRPGSRPGRNISSGELEDIRNLLLSSTDRLEQDLEQGLFGDREYNGFVTRYGVALNSIDEALHFLPFHEGLHTGYIQALKRLLSR